MNVQIPGLRAALKSAIKSNATEITVNRALARSRFAEARRLRAAGDEAGAAATHNAAWKARGDADARSPLARQLLLAYAFLRGVPLVALERTRSRAPAVSEGAVLDALEQVLPASGDVAAVRALRGACAVWVAAALQPAPAVEAVTTTTGEQFAEAAA